MRSQRSEVRNEARNEARSEADGFFGRSRSRASSPIGPVGLVITNRLERSAKVVATPPNAAPPRPDACRLTGILSGPLSVLLLGAAMLLTLATQSAAAAPDHSPELRSTEPGTHRAERITLAQHAPEGNAKAQAPATARLLVQDSPLAGFRYHEAPTMFSTLREGDALELVREPANGHDSAAIRVEWRGHMLGYVPRAQNKALAWALDRGERVRARVSRLQEHPNPRERVRFEVFIE